MLKMFRDRENGLCGGACRDSAQISRHLEKADTETLVDELMELTERAANGDVNLEQIDAYLPYAEVERYPIEIGETKEYDTLQDAVEALGIAAPLVPSWVPERYILLSVSVDHRAAGAAIYADYKSEDGRLNFRFSESARANQQIIEKDGTMEQIVLVKNIRHHILADQTETKISWINGDFECRASGDISEQEAKKIINSIYKED